MIYTIFEGTKAKIIDDGILTIECEPNDIDTAYEALCESVEFVDEEGKPFPFEDYSDPNSKASALLVDFQNAKDDDVQTLLDDMKRMEFISAWEATNSTNL